MEYHEVKVSEVIQRGPRVKSVRFLPVEGCAFQAGQFMDIWLLGRKELSHYLSISNSPTEKGYIECTKKLTASQFSAVFDGLKEGDLLKVRYPLGQFTLRQASRKISFIAGGIGITPVRSMCKYIADSRFAIDTVLLYANRTAADIVFKEDFDRMQEPPSSLKVVHILCEADQGIVCKVGRIDAGVIRAEIPDYKERVFYLCGPPPMVEGISQQLLEYLEVGSDQVVTERFKGY
jgi:glycine betaine catabolism B